MRLWGLPVEDLCDKHLLGEHHEIHMIDGTLRLHGPGRLGRLLDGLVDLSQLNARHRALVREMGKRGFVHTSPLRRIRRRGGWINKARARRDLKARCRSCRV